MSLLPRPPVPWASLCFTTAGLLGTAVLHPVLLWPALTAEFQQEDRGRLRTLGSVSKPTEPSTTALTPSAPFWGVDFPLSEALQIFLILPVSFVAHSYGQLG